MQSFPTVLTALYLVQYLWRYGPIYPHCNIIATFFLLTVYAATDEGILEDEAATAPATATALLTERESILGPEPQPVAVPQVVVPPETFTP